MGPGFGFLNHEFLPLYYTSWITSLPPETDAANLLTCSNACKLLGAHNRFYNQYRTLKCMDVRPGHPDYFSVMAHDHEWVDQSSKEKQTGPNKEAAWSMLVRACSSARYAVCLYVCTGLLGCSSGELAYLQAKQPYSAPLQDATGRERSMVRERFDYPEGLKDPPRYLLLSRKVYEKMDAIFPDAAIGKRRKHRSHTGTMRITASSLSLQGFFNTDAIQALMYDVLSLASCLHAAQPLSTFVEEQVHDQKHRDHSIACNCRKCHHFQFKSLSQDFDGASAQRCTVSAWAPSVIYAST